MKLELYKLVWENQVTYYVVLCPEHNVGLYWNTYRGEIQNGQTLTGADCHQFAKDHIYPNTTSYLGTTQPSNYLEFLILLGKSRGTLQSIMKRVIRIQEDTATVQAELSYV